MLCVMGYLIYAIPPFSIKNRCSATCFGTVTAQASGSATAEYTVDGKTYEAKGNVPDNVDDTIDVRYNPNNPKESYIGNEPVSQISPVFYTLVIVFCCASGLCFRLGWRA